MAGRISIENVSYVYNLSITEGKIVGYKLKDLKNRN
jgi:hypothetical protein